MEALSVWGSVFRVVAKADPRVTSMYDAKLVRPELQVRGGLGFTEGES